MGSKEQDTDNYVQERIAVARHESCDRRREGDVPKLDTSTAMGGNSKPGLMRFMRKKLGLQKSSHVYPIGGGQEIAKINLDGRGVRKLSLNQ